jgi:hypothetical protein
VPLDEIREVLARAAYVGGDRASGGLWKRRAQEAVAGIDDADDRLPIEQDLATLPG